MKNQRIVYAILALSIVLTLVFSACTSRSESTPEPAPEPVQQNILTVAFVDDVSDVDPRSSYDSGGLSVLYHMYEALTFYNPPGSEEEISPWLATSWESNEDKTEWTFHLRKEVKFHDGADFNAEAVKYTIENVKDGGFAPSWIFSAIESMEAVDEYTIKFTCSGPTALDLILSSAFGAWMISPSSPADPEWFNDGNSSGTGPYKFASREVGTRLVLEHHEDYWGGWQKGQFTTIVFNMIEDATVREQMIRSGEADVVYDINPDSLASLMEGDGVEVKIEPAYVCYFMHINTKRPPLDDVRVRQALAHSYPYEAVRASLLGGLGTKASGFVPQILWGSHPDISVEYNLEKAKELLTEAGYPEGGFDLVYWAFEGSPLYTQLAELWLPELEKLGVNLEIQSLNGEAIYEKATTDPEHAHDFLGNNWFPTYVTPLDFLVSPFATEQPINFSYYANSEFDDLLWLGDSQTAMDREAAIETFQKAGKMLVDDAAGIFVMDAPQIFVLRDDLSGYTYSPAYSCVFPYYNLRR